MRAVGQSREPYENPFRLKNGLARNPLGAQRRKEARDTGDEKRETAKPSAKYPESESRLEKQFSVGSRNCTTAAYRSCNIRKDNARGMSLREKMWKIPRGRYRYILY